MQSSPAHAIFAGGCFWCTEAAFAGTEGVLSVTSGYTGGGAASPSYEQVCSGKTGHTEAIEIVYDPGKVEYSALLDIFWSGIDPTDEDGQFYDRGSQYRTAIFYFSGAQLQEAEASKRRAEARLGQKIVTEIAPAGAFYPAEAYHQGYAQKNPLHYNAYKLGSGRPSRLKALWDK